MHLAILLCFVCLFIIIIPLVLYCPIDKGHTVHKHAEKMCVNLVNILMTHPPFLRKEVPYTLLLGF